ncbi:enolase C-terminal domain-like protein, partial [Klebsiella pneumoniae]|uniref:enolase C-terminal domain-like protein n=1 Tax=Klebsiella pneumoniae TaxID=573 RepID=UPI003CECB728
NDVLAYATGLYFPDMDRLVAEAVEEAQGYVKAGFKAIKMKIGLGSIERDIERVAAVRKAIGPDIRLMVDAN